MEKDIKEKNIIMEIKYLKENIKMEKDIKEKNIIMEMNYYLKENINSEKDIMEKEKNINIMKKFNLYMKIMIEKYILQKNILN